MTEETQARRKLLWLSDANTAHTERWVRELAARGHRILLFSLTSPRSDSFRGIPNLEIETANIRTEIAYSDDGSVRKLLYLKCIPQLQKLNNVFRPEVVHAHYASSYGVVSGLAGLRPRVVSVWGADVYRTAQRSFLHRQVVRWALRSADLVLSTSWTMQRHALQLCRRPIEVVPFGIDFSRFVPPSEDRSGSTTLTIGTVKSLEEKYGIEYLVKAFALVRGRNPSCSLRLLIVGGGSGHAALVLQVAELGLTEVTEIAGRVPYSEAHLVHQRLDIAVFPSVEDSESFGVSVVEAQACGRPVIVSRVGGLPEVVEEGRTALVTPPRDVPALAAAMERLIHDRSYARAMGKAGRERVRSMYDLRVCIRKLEDHYDRLVGRS